MKEMVRKIIASLDTVTPDGFSARKLSGFTVVFMIVICHLTWVKWAFIHNDFSLFPSVLAADISFVVACFITTTAEKMHSNSLNKDKDEPKS